MDISSNPKKATKGRMFNTNQTTSNVLKNVTTMKCKDTDEELFPEQIGNYLLYLSHGSKKVIFSIEKN